MRIVGYIAVAWLLLQVYPHIHIDFAPAAVQKDAEKVKPEKFKMLDNGLLDYYPEVVEKQTN